MQRTAVGVQVFCHPRAIYSSEHVQWLIGLVTCCSKVTVFGLETPRFLHEDSGTSRRTPRSKGHLDKVTEIGAADKSAPWL